VGSALGPRKTTKTLMELAGRRTCRMHTDCYPAVRVSNARTLTAVPLCSFLFVQYKHADVFYRGFNCAFGWMSNPLSLCSSVSMIDQVSHPHKTTGQITVRVFQFLYFKIADGSEWHSLRSVCPQFSAWSNHPTYVCWSANCL
jgi:hypothetical protein